MTLTRSPGRNPTPSARAMQGYGSNRSGPLTSVGVYTYAYLPVPAQTHQRLRDLVTTRQPSSTSPPLTHTLRIITSKMFLDPNKPSAAYHSVTSQTPNAITPTQTPRRILVLTIATMLSHPLSRGSVHIQSPEPTPTRSTKKS
jgi:hypothetical protein